jgi:hypothetical protein
MKLQAMLIKFMSALAKLDESKFLIECDNMRSSLKLFKTTVPK